MNDYRISFTIPETTVATVSLEIRYLLGTLSGEHLYAQGSADHWRLQAAPGIEDQWDGLQNGVDRSAHRVRLQAVAHNEDDEPIKGETRTEALSFDIRQEPYRHVRVNAVCRFPPVADGFSALLRGLAQLGAQPTREQLLDPCIQERLGEIISEDEEQEWEKLRLALPRQPAISEASPQHVFSKTDDVWRIVYGECSFHLVDRKGLGLIHELLRRPNHHFSPTELETALEGAGAELPRRDEREELNGVSDGGINQPMLDERAIAEVKQALEGLKGQLQVAEVEGDNARVSELEAKIEKTEGYLRTSTGKGGKPRTFPDEFERARVRVTQNIGTAFRAIEEKCPDLAEYLNAYIETGNRLHYKLQSPENPWIL